MARGLMLVVSSPSGGGKSTLCNMLREQYPRIGYSTSYTTRAPRGKERDGKDYHFVTDQTFDQMVEEQQFAEWALVHGNRYGTARDTVDQALDNEEDLLFDIDWQGALQLRDAYPDDAVLVFILPPSPSVLRSRLEGRGTDDPEVIQRRLAAARGEIEQAEHYHYLLLNGELQQAFHDLEGIYRAAHCATARQKSLFRSILADEQWA